MPYPKLSRWLAPRGCDDQNMLEHVVSGRTVLVTGSSYGIGRALALRLGRVGARVILAARSFSELQAVAEEIAELGGQAFPYAVDLRNSTEVDALAQQIIQQHDGVDIVVHNAGKSIRRCLYDSFERAHDFERTMATNYLGPVRLQLALLPSMMKRGGGQIVNVSSVGVRLPTAVGWSAYTASKTAFQVWLSSVAPELRHSKIDCTQIYLGLVHTAMSAPTAAYASLPGQTADQAACVICRALIERPTSLSPWWLEPLRFLSLPLESVFARWQYCFGPKPPKIGIS